MTQVNPAETGAEPTAAERERIQQADEGAGWRDWGPYVAERAWGTVREDYSADGEAWDFFPHDHARSRAYRWNEDGMAANARRGKPEPEYEPADIGIFDEGGTGWSWTPLSAP